MPKGAVFERTRRQLSLDVSVGVHILLVVGQSSLESQSRGCAKTVNADTCGTIFRVDLLKEASFTDDQHFRSLSSINLYFLIFLILRTGMHIFKINTKNVHIL